MKYFLIHSTIHEGTMEYGSTLVTEAKSAAAAQRHALNEEIDCTGKDEEDIDISAREIPKEDYEVLRKYLGVL